MNVDFITAIKMYFANYANFKGRSTRAEYWWAMLFVVLVSSFLSFFGAIGNVAYMIWGLVCVIPTLAISIRRLHDSSLSGWWAGAFYIVCYAIAGILIYTMFDIFVAAASGGAISEQAILEIMTGGKISTIGLCVFAALVLYIVWIITMCRKSSPDNQYGPNPYGE